MNSQKKPTCRQTFAQKFGKPIEEYDSVKRAVESVREVTRQNYYRVLPGYFLFLNEDPDHVIEQRRKDIGSSNYEQAENYERKTMAFANALLSKGQSGRGVQGIIGRVQGFFANNSRRYSLDMRRLKLPKARKVQKYSPSNEELRHLYTMADTSRDKLLVALAYQNGLAPVDISLLNVGDLPLEEWAYYEKSRSKTGEIFRAIITPDLAYELKNYLKIRGNPSKGEPLFLGRFGALDNQAISGVISELIEKSGLDGNNGFKPTSLRDAFEDALVEANVNHKIKEALMGHVSNIEHEYGGMNRLIVNITEAMKKAYPLLTLNGLTRMSTQQGVSKEEFEALKAESELLKETLVGALTSMVDANLIPRDTVGALMERIARKLPLIDTGPISAEAEESSKRRELMNDARKKNQKAKSSK
ncbi:tyrosine-type recombinase/integrase [Candidatus Bathyarchaeota archaeon]|nr:tyrosine-type recombinase/integrase [Candidatus Bathyarchaeota archaeon]